MRIHGMEHSWIDDLGRRSTSAQNSEDTTPWSLTGVTAHSYVHYKEIYASTCIREKNCLTPYSKQQRVEARMVELLGATVQQRNQVTTERHLINQRHSVGLGWSSMKLSSECGTHATIKDKIWPWISGKSLWNLSSRCLFAQKRVSDGPRRARI